MWKGMESVWGVQAQESRKLKNKNSKVRKTAERKLLFRFVGDAKRDCNVPYLMVMVGHAHERSGVLWWSGGGSGERQRNPPLYIQWCSLEFGDSISQPVGGKCQPSVLLGKIIKSCILGSVNGGKLCVSMWGSKEVSRENNGPRRVESGLGRSFDA
jgi:hypothetical protein